MIILNNTHKYRNMSTPVLRIFDKKVTELENCKLKLWKRYNKNKIRLIIVRFANILFYRYENFQKTLDFSLKVRYYIGISYRREWHVKESQNRRYCKTG